MLVYATGCTGQSRNVEQKKDLVLTDLVKRSVEQFHFDPPAFDDTFSQKAFDEYFKQVDPFKRFFTQQDINELSKYKDQIDDEFKNYEFNFFNDATDILTKRLTESESLMKEILSKPLNFDKKEQYEIDPEKRAFAKDLTAWKESWKQSLKYEVLTRLAESIENQEKKKFDPEKGEKPKAYAEMEADARDKVLKRYTDWFHEITKMERSDRMADYINAIMAVLDPHTNYFPPKDKEDFDITFSGQLEGIGATLTQKDGYITVAAIVPGSPSWKQGDLAVDDKILKVAQGDGEPVDVVDMRLDKAVRLVRGKKGTKVTLTVRKVDGTEKQIPITRDIVVIEETYAKSAIITDSITGSRMGYIYLPSFYANFENPNGRSSAGDVTKEVTRLKKENVDGIILDLRNDGGGSLQDAIEIAGLFIDQGPVVQVKGRGTRAQAFGDPAPGVLWEGPLAIMINPFSASASEILAAAMQDHKRAVIIGSTSFGKGTVQRFLELDDIARGFDDVKPLGAIKMTIQKFYRINGGATQLKGVTPDVLLPDQYAYMDVGERDLDNPMPWTEIAGTPFTPVNSEALFKKLAQTSKTRIGTDSTFTKMDEYAKKLKEQRDKTLIPLDLAGFRKDKAETEKMAKRFSKVGDHYRPVKVLPLSGETIAANDTTKVEMQKRWVRNLRKDAYIFESMKVLSDWNKLVTKKD
jgi:carboxyl-terminal processing protease